MSPAGTVFEDELALELEDNPGTTTGTTFSVLHRILSHSCSDGAFDHWPHSWEYPCSSQSLPSDRTAGVSLGYLHRHEEIKIVNVYLCFPRLFALPHWPLPPMWGFLDLRTASISSELGSFLLSSRPRIVVPLESLKWAPALPWLQQESKA